MTENSLKKNLSYN